MQRLMLLLLTIIAICQVTQTVHYLATPATAGDRAIPVIIDGISSRAANESHALPVKMREPIRMHP